MPYISEASLNRVKQGFKVAFHKHDDCMVKNDASVAKHKFVTDDVILELGRKTYPCARCHSEDNPKAPKPAKKTVDPMYTDKWPKTQLITLWTTSDGNEFTSEVEALQHQISLFQKG